MHIGIVTNAVFPDHNMFAREQSAALVDMGHRVTVFARAVRQPRWPQPAGIELVEAHWEEDPDRFACLVAEIRPDVLHVQERRGCGRALRCDVPAVVEITSISLRPFPLRHLALARKMWELRGGHSIGTANRALIGPLRPADFYAPNGYSSWALRVAKERVGDPPDNQLTVYQGTFDPLRRLDRMLEAFRLVVNRLPHAMLCCLGGSARDRERLASHVRRLDLGDHVHLLGRIGPEELTDTMSRAAMTVSWIPPSTGFQHQPPLKILDAQASTVPVLATPTEATRELLEFGGGRLAPARVEPFAGEWARMLRDVRAGTVAPLHDREGFLHERSWSTIVRDYWIPRYVAMHNPADC